MAVKPHSTPAVTVTQESSWVAYHAGAVELDMQPDGRGCVALMSTTLSFDSPADLAQLRDLVRLFDDAQVRAALGL